MERDPLSRVGSPSPDAETTLDLLSRARTGDEDAANRLFARYLPLLRRWARGRLPTYARDLGDTEDLVQDTLYQALRHLGNFEHRHPGSLQAYLRQAILNRIRDLVRRAHRHPAAATCEEDMAEDRAASPLEEAIGRQALDRYERALAALKDDEREVIVARVELGLPFAEIASLTGRPSADAARMATARALVRLAEEMGRAPR